MNQLMHLPAKQLSRGFVAENPRARRIGEDTGAAQIDSVDRFGRRIEQEADPLLAVGDLLSRAHELGDVSRDCRDADNRVGGVENRGVRDRYVDEASVLPPTGGLQPLDAAAVARLTKNLVNLFLPAGRVEEACMPSHRFLRGVSVQTRGPVVPRRNHAVEGLADDRIVGRFDDGR
jgi:hypothetical protein